MIAGIITVLFMIGAGIGVFFLVGNATCDLGDAFLAGMLALVLGGAFGAGVTEGIEYINQEAIQATTIITVDE